jgi:hypothetical protein
MSTKVINIKSGEPYDVYIGRAGKGKSGYFGNPHTLGGVYCEACKGFHDRNGAIEAFKKDFYKRISIDEVFKTRVLELKDKVLGCFCKQATYDVACHGDVYVEYLDNLK